MGHTSKAEQIRAALQETEARVRETLKDLENNDMDTDAVVDRIQNIEKSVRQLRRAA
jgi:predicted nuclease with TOPRIM domain